MLSYKDYGLQVSTTLDTDYVEAIETQVKDAYITPLKETLDEGETLAANKVIAPLAWLLMAQRGSVVTRSGAKLKVTEQSDKVSQWEQIAAVAKQAYIELDAFAILVGGKLESVRDICGIFFKTNYFYL